MILKLATMLGVPKFVVWGGIVLLAIGLFFGAKALYDHSIIDAHDTKVNLEAAKADRAADQAAAEQAAKDKVRLDFEQDQLEGAVKNAPKDPNVADDTERRLAFHRCLRLQQRAAANGLEPPRCV